MADNPDLQFNHNLADPAVTLGNIKQDGWLFGGFFGAQKQWGSIVLGIEGDVDAAGMKGSVQGSNSTFHSFLTGFDNGIDCAATDSGCDPIRKTNSVSMDAKIDMLASLRGKVGWSFAPNWLIYGTGGAAFAHVENTIAQSASVNFCDEAYIGGLCTNSGFARIISGTTSFNGTGGDTLFGWAAGAGIDWKLPLDPGSALVFGVEYLHYGFPEQTITLAGTDGGTRSVTAKDSDRQGPHKLLFLRTLSSQACRCNDKAPGNVPGLFFLWWNSVLSRPCVHRARSGA